jgi:exodeoxyribonuclease VII small subunit
MSADNESKSNNSEKRTLGFEDKVERLRNITESLETCGFNLEESLKLYKEGIALAGECRRELEEARHMVRIYTGDGLREFAGAGAKNEGDNEL